MSVTVQPNSSAFGLSDPSHNFGVSNANAVQVWVQDGDGYERYYSPGSSVKLGTEYKLNQVNDYNAAKFTIENGVGSKSYRLDFRRSGDDLYLTITDPGELLYLVGDAAGGWDNKAPSDWLLKRVGETDQYQITTQLEAGNKFFSIYHTENGKQIQYNITGDNRANIDIPLTTTNLYQNGDGMSLSGNDKQNVTLTVTWNNSTKTLAIASANQGDDTSVDNDKEWWVHVSNKEGLKNGNDWACNESFFKGGNIVWNSTAAQNLGTSDLKLLVWQGVNGINNAHYSPKDGTSEIVVGTEYEMKDNGENMVLFKIKNGKANEPYKFTVTRDNNNKITMKVEGNTGENGGNQGGDEDSEKAVYLEYAEGDYFIWYWKDGGTSYADVAFRSLGGWNSNRPNLNNADDFAKLKGAIVTTTDGKKYYKVMLPKDTDRINVKKAGDKTLDADYVYNSNGKTNTKVSDLNFGELDESIAQLYIGGDLAGGWNKSNWEKNKWKLSPTGNANEYQISITIPNGNYFSVFDAKDEKQYNVSVNRENLNLPLAATTLDQKTDAMRLGASGDQQVVITVVWSDATKTIAIQDASVEILDYTGSYWGVPNANNGWASQHVAIEKVPAGTIVYKNGKDGDSIDVNPDDQWVSINKGYADRNYDGLGLGLDYFCVTTRFNAEDAALRYWATESATEIVPGNTYQLKMMTEGDAKNKMKIVNNGTNKKQDRYDVIFNWEDKTMIVVPNNKWVTTPDQMYMYLDGSNILERDDFESDVAYEEKLAAYSAPATLTTFPHTDMENDVPVVILHKNGSGDYEFNRLAASDLPLKPQCKLVIYGSTGVRYKVADVNEYQLNDDNWNKVSNLKLENDVNAEGYLLVNSNNMVASEFTISVNPNIDGAVCLSIIKKVEAPVKWSLKEQGSNNDYTAEGTETEMTKNADGSFTLSHVLAKDKFYTLIAEYSNGTKEHYSYTGSGANDTYWVNGDASSKLSVKDKNIKINTDAFATATAPAKLTVNWNNGEPTLRIQATPKKEKTVRVYFVDRANWGNIHCYNYSDAQLTETATQVPKSDRNADFPGVGMTQCTDNKVKTGVDTDAQIYQIDLKVNEYEDGTYDRPKVIFAREAGTQTENLYLVNGGIYTNASKSNSDGLVEHPATEYLPRMQYNWEDNPTDQEVSVYPNDFYSTDYNVIYVDDQRMINHIKSGQKISVNIKWDRTDNGVKDFIATGIAGKHHMNLVKIGNKELIRVSIASDVIPNHTPVDIDFWFGDNKTPEVTNNWENKHKGDDPHFASCDMNGVHYDGKHFTCYDSYCSLNFTDVDYSDGNVYRRYVADEKGGTQEPVISIRELVTPEHLYIVDKAADKNAFDYAINDAKQFKSETLTIDGTSYTVYEVQPDKTLGEKLGYTVPNIKPDAQFDFIVYYKDDAQPYYYSGTGNPTNMRPGNNYTFFNRTAQNGTPDKWYDFTINHTVIPTALSYNLLIEWNESSVSVEANKPNANVQFALYDPETKTYSPVPLDGHVYELIARSDEFQSSNNDNGKAYSYDKVYFFVDGLYNASYSDGKSLDELMTASIVRDPDYEKYFKGDTKNQRAHFAIDKEPGNTPEEVHANDSYEITGINIEQAGNATTPALASVRVVTHTANTFVLKLRQRASSNNYARASFNIPVRVYPSPKSVGLRANNANVTMDRPSDKDCLDFSVPVGSIDHEDKYTHAIFKDGKLHFQCMEADEVAATGSDKKLIKIYWEANDEAAPAAHQLQRRASIMRITPSNIASSDEDPYKNLLVSDSSKEWSSTNTPQLSKAELDNGVEYKKIKLQIQQNGINSPMYYLTLNGIKNNDALTGVEGIEGEAVVEYYDLNGYKVSADNLQKGIYIKVVNGKAEKVNVR